jgi:leucyl-tRNA synthetase
VQGITYKNPHTGRYIPPAEVADPNDPRDPITGDVLETFYEKMSKSKHNGVDPSVVIDRYGADTARMFILFKAPPEKDLEWDDADVEGQFRFLQRLWRLVDGACAQGLRLAADSASAASEREVPAARFGPGELSAVERELRRAVHTAIAAISEDLEGDLQFNTAVSELMKLSNAMAEHLTVVSEPVAREALRVLLLLLAPFSPHLAEELWQRLSDHHRRGEPISSVQLTTCSIHCQPWPILDPAALARDTIPLVIQVKGKVRGSLVVPADADSATLEQLALSSEIAARWLDGRTPSRVIVVPGKLVNLVP